MNILIIGNCSDELINLIKKSKLLDKLYITANDIENNLPKIEYSTIEELAKKIKRTQIDAVLVSSKDLISNGSVDFFKKCFINVISPNEKWFNLEKSQMIAKQLLSHYSINFPKIILAPKDFPVIIKTDSYSKNKIANSMNELINYMQEFQGEKTFLEEYLDGNRYSLLVLWDKKTAKYFIKDNLTEVQNERLALLQTKLNFLLSDEKADFMGFFSLGLIWAKNDWHVLNFNMCFDEKLVLENLSTDLLYLLNLLIYQKLDEI